jgi:hypothetical protein
MEVSSYQCSIRRGNLKRGTSLRGIVSHAQEPFLHATTMTLELKLVVIEDVEFINAKRETIVRWLMFCSKSLR